MSDKYAALRAAAEKATPGPWEYYHGNTSIEYNVDSMEEDQGSVLYVNSGDFTQKQTNSNGEFIAAANPATILSLLAEREADKARIARLESERDALRDRIAELESRKITVKLPKRISVLYRRDFTDAHRTIYAYPTSEVHVALVEAGITLETGE